MRIGIMGGTFDPIHIGHLIVAEEARARMELEEVVFVPAGRPYLRAQQPAAPAGARAEMVRRAIAGNPYFRMSTVELERTGPTYTVETLRQLQEGLGAEASLYLIVGADSLAELHRWHEPQELLARCTLVVYPRAAAPLGGGLDEAEQRLPGVSQRVALLDAPLIGVTATEVRRRVARGLSIRYWVPAAVERFIREQGLYREEGI